MLYVRKVCRNLQDYGLLITLRKGSLYFFRRLYHIRNYRIYRVDLSSLTLQRDLQEKSLSYRFISPDNVDRIREIEAMEEWLHGQVAEKIEAGGLCLIAAEGGKLAGFNLVGFGSVHIPAVEMDRSFRPGFAWSEQISVSRDFRGRGLASELRYRVMDELRRRGFTRFYGGTFTDNIASLKLARRVGFQEIADIHFRRVLGRRSWRYVRVRKQDT